MKAIFTLVLVFTISIISAQKPMKKIATSVRLDDNMYEFVYRNKLMDEVKDTSKIYYYFSKGQLHNNQGVLVGNYLTGSYKVFSDSGLLMEKGEFCRGLKHGTWLYFDRTGKILKEDKWRRGELLDPERKWYSLSSLTFGLF